MKAKDFLTNEPTVSLGYVAKKMWPTNRRAENYLYLKLNGKDPKRPWTEKDEELACKVLYELGVDLQKKFA